MSQNKNQNEQWMLLVLLLKEIAEKKGVTQGQIAEQTGLLQSNISRFFSLKYKPTLDTFLQISKAIKVNFFFEDQESKTDLNEAMEHAMEELSAISQSAQDPKGFAVVGELAKSLSDLSKTLMYMHKGRGNSEPGGNSNVLTPSQVSVENAVFVGSTADLMSMRAAK